MSFSSHFLHFIPFFCQKKKKKYENFFSLSPLSYSEIYQFCLSRYKLKPCLKIEEKVFYFILFFFPPASAFFIIIISLTLSLALSLSLLLLLAHTPLFDIPSESGSGRKVVQIYAHIHSHI
jgi:hypothetical protein